MLSKVKLKLTLEYFFVKCSVKTPNYQYEGVPYTLLFQLKLNYHNRGNAPSERRTLNAKRRTPNAKLSWQGQWHSPEFFHKSAKNYPILEIQTAILL